MQEAVSGSGRSGTVHQVGSLVSIFLTDGPVVDFAAAAQADTVSFGDYFWHMLRRGNFLAPSQFEAGFLSTAHTEGEIDRTCNDAYEWLSR